VTDAYGVPLVVNDSLRVALAANAAGLHIGQADGDVADSRRRLGPDKVLGVSVQTVAQARAAEAAGADYLGVGAVFPTATKPDAADVPRQELIAICASVHIPVVAIGGIHAGNVRELAGTGIAGIAVVSALFGQPGHVREAAVELRRLAKHVCVL
jgi:thiamine-phosphate pyrophosphorylase